jgi:hypothetical protein
MEWLKVKALNSNTSTAKKKKKKYHVLQMSLSKGQGLWESERLRKVGKGGSEGRRR